MLNSRLIDKLTPKMMEKWRRLLPKKYAHVCVSLSDRGSSWKKRSVWIFDTGVEVGRRTPSNATWTTFNLRKTISFFADGDLSISGLACSLAARWRDVRSRVFPRIRRVEGLRVHIRANFLLANRRSLSTGEHELLQRFFIPSEVMSEQNFHRDSLTCAADQRD